MQPIFHPHLLHNPLLLQHPLPRRWRAVAVLRSLRLPALVNITCIRNLWMHHTSKHAISKSKKGLYSMVRKFTFFTAPPCCFRCPSPTLAFSPLTTFSFGPLCYAIFIFGLLYSPTNLMPLARLIWAPAAIWSFSTSVMWALFLRTSRRSSCSNVESPSFPSSFPLFGASSLFSSSWSSVFDSRSSGWSLNINYVISTRWLAKANQGQTIFLVIFNARMNTSVIINVKYVFFLRRSYKSSHYTIIESKTIDDTWLHGSTSF